VLRPREPPRKQVRILTDEIGKSEQALIAARRNNLAALRSRGNDPFKATRYDVTAHAADLIERYASLEKEESKPDEIHRLAGRIMAKRGTGKTLFVDLHDRVAVLVVAGADAALGKGRGALPLLVLIGGGWGVRARLSRL